MDIIEIMPQDNRYTVREALRLSEASRVLLVLPWEIERGWQQRLDYEVLRRELQQQSRDVAWVIHDPERRALPREVGFTVFPSVEAANAYLTRHETFPPLRKPAVPSRPHKNWWAEEPRPKPLPLPKPRPWWLLPFQLIVLLIVLITLGGFTFLTLPTAKITLTPTGTTFTRIIAISVDPTLTEIDLQRNLIPARYIGGESEAYAEVPTTGSGYSFTGYAEGMVIFTNLLGQDYRIAAGTIVRTSAGSYPVRFRTTTEVIIPPFGQVAAPVIALQEGPLSNVGPYQINQIEGVAGLAVRVTNPDATRGAESTTVALVAEADRERAWSLAAARVLDQAYEDLQVLLEPGEFLARESLSIEAVPRAAYTHITGERSETLGLNLRLLVRGRAVDLRDAQAVAYHNLAAHLPAGYTLTAARFTYGEIAEEDVGPGIFTFYVTAEGYASAEISIASVREALQGRPVTEAHAYLTETLPLARAPEIVVEPAWYPLIPHLPLRLEISVVPENW